MDGGEDIDEGVSEYDVGSGKWVEDGGGDIGGGVVKKYSHFSYFGHLGFLVGKVRVPPSCAW